MKNSLLKMLVVSASVIVFESAMSSTPHSPQSDPVEHALFQLFDALNDDYGQKPLKMAEALVTNYPTFKLGQLLYADLLASQGMTAPVFSDIQRRELDELRDEAMARWRHRKQHPKNGRVASNLLQLSDEYRHVLVFDMSDSRLYLFENRNTGPELVADYYMSIGKGGFGKQVEGDNKTPLGVYRITEFLPDSRLPELYGAGAYPIDYPSSWDKLNGKTGYGIWLHGVPRSSYSRPPLDSEGCMVVSNSNLAAIGEMVDLRKTPVVLSSRINWVTRSQLANTRATLEQHVQAWRSDWNSLDVDAYLQHYSKDFVTREHSFDSWRSHKRRVAASKTFIEVNLDRKEMFLYPENSESNSLAMVSFIQNYKSNNFSSSTRKHQFWRREGDGHWRIIFEGT